MLARNDEGIAIDERFNVFLSVFYQKTAILAAG
jgi:hypothetical protein